MGNFFAVVLVMLTLSDKGADLIYFTEDLPMAKTEQITTKTKIAGYFLSKLYEININKSSKSLTRVKLSV